MKKAFLIILNIMLLNCSNKEQKKEIVYREIEGQTDADGNPLREKDVITYDDFVFYYYFEKIN